MLVFSPTTLLVLFHTNEYLAQMDTQPVQFLTATILNWKPLLNSKKYKQIILDSLSYLVSKKKCKVFGFVIMPNHIHMLWQIQNPYKRANTQRDFLKFTGQMMKMDLQNNNSEKLQAFYVNLKDREYQFWQRNSLSVDIDGREMMEQKLDYIHNNPVQGKWMLADSPLEYNFSSFKFYEEGESQWSFLSHYMEYFE